MSILSYDETLINMHTLALFLVFAKNAMLNNLINYRLNHFLDIPLNIKNNKTVIECYALKSYWLLELSRYLMIETMTRANCFALH